MRSGRSVRLALQILGLILAASAPALASPEKGWLAEHRGTLWTVFYVQLGLFLLLGAWEAAFQMQRKKGGLTSSSSPAGHETEERGQDDPFKTQISARRPLPPPPTPQASDTENRGGLSRPPAPPPPLGGAPSLAQIARQSAADDEASLEPKGGRRLGRIENTDSSDKVQRPSVPSTPAARVPPPPAPLPRPQGPAAPAPAAESGGESWADVLKRTTQDGDRQPRRAVPIPPPTTRTPPRPPEPEAVEPEPAVAGALDDVVSTRTARTVRPGGPAAQPPSPPESVVPIEGGGMRMPTGASRYAWDHALNLLQSAVVMNCRLVAGGGASGATTTLGTISLVTPPPAAAEKRRGRGMTISSGETTGRTSPIRPESDGVPGFTGHIQPASPAPPPPLQPVKRVGDTPARPPLSSPTSRMSGGGPPAVTPPGSRESTPPPRTGTGAPLAPPSARVPGSSTPPVAPPSPVTRPPSVAPPSVAPPVSRVPPMPPRSPGGASLSPPGARLPGAAPPAAGASGSPPRRSLEMPTRRIDLEPKTVDALRDASGGGGAAASPITTGADATGSSIQKEIQNPLRRAESNPKQLEISKGLRENADSDEADPQ